MKFKEAKDRLADLVFAIRYRELYQPYQYGLDWYFNCAGGGCSGPWLSKKTATLAAGLTLELHYKDGHIPPRYPVPATKRQLALYHLT